MKIPNTKSSYITINNNILEETHLKVMIGSGEDIKNIILHIYNVDDAWLFMPSSNKRNMNYLRYKLELSEKFFFTEEMFLKGLDVFTNTKYELIVKDICRISDDFKSYYEKYKLLIC